METLLKKKQNNIAAAKIEQQLDEERRKAERNAAKRKNENKRIENAEKIKKARELATKINRFKPDGVNGKSRGNKITQFQSLRKQIVNLGINKKQLTESNKALSRILNNKTSKYTNYYGIANRQPGVNKSKITALMKHLNTKYGRKPTNYMNYKQDLSILLQDVGIKTTNKNLNDIIREYSYSKQQGKTLTFNNLIKKFKKPRSNTTVPLPSI